MAPLKYEGSSSFRQRIIAAVLSGNSLRIDKIREHTSIAPGLHDYEASFLRLVEKLTDGFNIEINTTGTSLKLIGGITLIGGGPITHDCGNMRSIGWFIEGILPILMFCKNPVNLIFNGITNDELDLSVDVLQAVTLPLLQNFGIYNVSLKVKRRGAAPKGGGIVELSSPIVRSLQPINVTDEGLIKKIRGIAYCTKISPTILTRVVDSCRGVLNHFIPDVYIHTDHYKGKDGGDSPGYSLALIAESTTGVLLSVERTARTRNRNIVGLDESINQFLPVGMDNGGSGEIPEVVGEEAAVMILEEIRKGGVVDSTHQCLILQLMVLTPEDVSKVRFGTLTIQAMETLRIIRDAFGIIFKIKEDRTTIKIPRMYENLIDEDNNDYRDDDEEIEDDDVPKGNQNFRVTTLLSCLGTGYVNVNRIAS